MTIAIGVLCPGGAVLVTDSLNRRFTDAGCEGFIDPRPPHVDKDAGVAWVHSGTGSPVVDSVEVFREERAQLTAPGFVDLARTLFVAYDPFIAGPPVRSLSTYRALDGGEPSEEELRRNGAQEVVVASVPAGQMALLTDDDERWFEGRGVVVAGAPTLWAREKGFERYPSPVSLEGAIQFALTIAAEFLDHVYGKRTLVDFAAEGLIPPAAYPLNVTAISPVGEFQTWSLPS